MVDGDSEGLFNLCFLGAPNPILEEFALPDCWTIRKIALKNIDSFVPTCVVHSRNIRAGVPCADNLETEVLKRFRLKVS
jgi:hypothetical protein